jgi:hypothetical protein
MSDVSHSDACAHAAAMREALFRLRQNLARFPGARRVAEVLAAAVDEWRRGTSTECRAALAAISANSNWSPQLVDASMDALLAPFSLDALISFAATMTARARLGGFIMPANVPGGGLHELVAALLSGAAAIVKTSHREPVFFPAFAHTLRRVDRAIGNRLEVVTFGRERDDLIRIMNDECDFIVALGDDASLARLAGASRRFGFGSRTSGALISLAPPTNFAALADAVARDVVLFEQQGCLSPHHIFIDGGDDAAARDFARSLALALSMLAEALPPAKLSFHTAAAIRRIRERARWRMIGAHDAELIEDRTMAWTVVFDPSAHFTMSPGYRTMTVSTIRDADDLASRLAPVTGRLEAFALAVAGPTRVRFLDVLAGAGVTYVCDPGRMQSPPLNWPHGGGAFLDFLAGRDE